MNKQTLYNDLASKYEQIQNFPVSEQTGAYTVLAFEKHLNYPCKLEKLVIDKTLTKVTFAGQSQLKKIRIKG